MSNLIETERTESALPLTLAVTKSFSGGVPGLATVLQIRDASTVDSYLDFSDLTFKTSGWTAKQASLADLGDGIYALSGGLNIDGITNLPTSTHYLSVEYVITGSVRGTVIDTILMKRDVYDMALSLLQRAIADAEPLPEFRSLGGAIQKLVNRVRITSSTLEIYETDDTTVSKTQAITTNPGADPIVEADTA